MASGNIMNPTHGNGFLIMPNGTIIQWGKISVTIPANGQSECTVNFSPAFDENRAAVTANVEIYSDPKKFSVLTRSCYQTNVVFRVGSTIDTEQTVTLNWIAIGR